MRILLFILGCLSFLGYYFYLIKRLRVHVFIAPALLITGLSVLMHLAGTHNILKLGFLSILLGGVYALWNLRKDISPAPFRGYAFAFFCVGLLVSYLLYYIWGANYADGDTMTHWALVIRSIYQENRFPNFLNTNIVYQGYPLAAAIWSYFGMQFLGYGEAQALFLQGLWQVLAGISLFSLNKENSKRGYILITLFIFYFMRGLDTLVVDRLLSFVALAGLCALWDKRTDVKNLAYYSLPYILCLPLIKSSGLIFAFYILFALFLLQKQNLGLRKAFLQTSLYLGICLFNYYLWYAFTQIVYEDAGVSRHALSIGAVQMVMKHREPGDYLAIAQNFLQKCFSAEAYMEWIALGLLTFLVLFLYFSEERKKGLFSTYFLLLACYLVFKVFLLLFYLGNMPGKGALEVNSYSRYQQSFDILLLGFCLGLAFHMGILAKHWKGKKSLLPSVALVLFLLILTPGIPKKLQRPDYATGGTHRKLLSLIADSNNGLAVGQKNICYNADPFTNLWMRFTFEHLDATGAQDAETIASALSENPEGFEYAILLKKDPEILALLNEKGLPEDSVVLALPQNNQP